MGCVSGMRPERLFGPWRCTIPSQEGFMKRSIAFLLPLALVACQDNREPLAPVIPDAAPTLSQAASDGVIPGRFIVTLREGVSPAAVASAYGVQPDYVYTHALNGFAGAMSDAARDGLLRDARVTRVEPDGIATASAVTQSNATWGIDRTDQRALPLSGTFTYTNTGSGVTAYIIDTGIDIAHAEFGGRASIGYDAIGDGQKGNDCNGHGTHVAGTTGGNTYGVAKAVKLVAVRVLDCGGSGTWSGVVAGIDWVVQNRVLPAVSNMSLGGGANSSVDAATTRMIDAGVASAVAAGNDSKDACMSSPARTPRAMTIGATTRLDEKARYSNVGDCIDWFAPGSGITSAWIGSGNTETKTISGTSMASPHTAGVAALYLESNKTATADAVRDALYANTTKGIVTRSRTKNNHLLFTNY